MNLDRLREIEDLKDKHTKALRTYQKRTLQDTQRIIRSVCEAFQTHMKDSSFQVEKVENSLVASYRNLTFTLTPSTAEEKRVGCITTMTIKDSRKPEEKTVVLVVDRLTGGNCIEWRSESSDEVEALREQIERTNQRTESFKKRSYQFVFYPEREPPENPYPQKHLSPPFATMEELMEAIAAC